eukprot:CAMPEP_0194536014 /NCGR_PEP_ID=MMETSP0253-20130528/74778_1 /TAXON_ID=2966 /ORGANISM="Noctiluca scintillans" /LENGTH=251 /DNA_ID=CAMNT_0039381879 /DNA_START=45 /DNA_END=800 /DNA_ORIENTATION=+
MDGGGGGFGAAMSMTGPPPQELAREFRTIKSSLVVLIFAIICKLVSGALVLQGNVFLIIYTSFDALLNILIGIFLLNDDPAFNRCYSCIVNTCCSTCPDQCPGGMSCLCTWFACCFVTTVIAVIPFNSSDIMQVISGVELLSDATNWASANLIVSSVGYLIYILSVTVAWVCQVIGGWAGWKAFQRANQVAEQLGTGDWAASGGGGGGQWGQGGGGQYLGGGSRPAQAPASEAPTRQAFTAFQGQGNRLGG